MMAGKSEPLFNIGAEIYDSFTFLRRPAELTAEKAQLSPGQKVLDIACGTGWATMKAARLVGEKGHVTGIDIADKLLDIARQKVGLGGFSNIKYLVGDAHKLAFEENTFDTVLCASSLFLFIDVCKALNENYRVLKTGGIMCFSTFSEGVFHPVMGLINNWIKKLPEYKLPTSPISITDSPEKCRDIFIDAGLGNVEITEENCVINFPDKEECWRQISGSLIVRPRLSGLSPDDYRTLKDEILLELEQRSTPQGISVDVPVIFCTVRKF
jgi:ubiquinone/menaquinone biosynthesis C-methylase UbiE